MTALEFLTAHLRERRQVPGALAECLFWAGVISMLRDGDHRPAERLPDPTAELGACLVDLATADDFPTDPTRDHACASLRALANHLEAGGPVPALHEAIDHLFRELGK